VRVAGAGDTADSDPFRFAIDGCFTIKHRGVVVHGELESGAVHRGDTLELVHAGTVIPTECVGINMRHQHGPDGTRQKMIGLMLRGISQFDVVAGDHVRTPE
jgi:translation elongation factor EF-Tu-like GTPase